MSGKVVWSSKMHLGGLRGTLYVELVDVEANPLRELHQSQTSSCGQCRHKAHGVRLKVRMVPDDSWLPVGAFAVV